MLDEKTFATETWRVSPDPMCILDRSGRFAALNPAWRDVLGWARSEMLGRSYLDFLHPDDVERSNAAFSDVLAGNPVLRFENRYRTRDDDYRWLSWVAVPEGDHFFCTVRDVTEDKRQRQRIDDQDREALVRKQFLAILGHDLRNPLAALSAGVRLLTRQEQSEKSLTVLRNMAASTIRMGELIENLMDLARIQLGGGITVQRLPMSDLDAQLSQIVEEIESAYEGAEIRVTIDTGGPILCDGPRLMQVVSNLLGNAVTHGAVDAPIDLEVTREEGMLRIFVCNRGTRISDASMETLFQPFFKGPAEDDHASPQGLGLGLFICSEIVAAHGGTIRVTSDDETTCFIVELPD